MNKTFWTQTLERCIKTAAQSGIAILAASSFSWISADWQAIAGTIATATALSLLTSLASLKLGPTDSPSVVAVDEPAHLVDIAPTA